MKTLTLLAMTSAALTVAAQTPTTAHSTAVHHTATTHAAAPAAGCVTPPVLSPKIPALPAHTPCVKALLTLTHLVSVSPLVSPELIEALGPKKETISLLYSEITPGTGALVKRGSFLSVKYTGWLTDGTKFDSSYDHPNAEPFPLQYGVARVIPAWNTGFEGMRVGGKRRLYIPYQLAYGEGGRAPIPPRAMLIFDLEVAAQSDKAPEPVQVAPPPPAKPATPPPAATTPPASTTTPPADAPKQ